MPPDRAESPEPATTSSIMRYSEIVPIWWLFTLIYGTIIATTISVLVARLASPDLPYVPLVTDPTASQALILFLLAIAILLVDWVWTSALLCDYPRGYPYYQCYLTLDPRVKIALLLAHTGYIVTYGISFSLLAHWETTKALFVAWDNPILWFAVSMAFANAWDFVALQGSLVARSSARYYVSMYGLMVAPGWWFLELPGAALITRHQMLFFIFMLSLLIFWRAWSLRPSNPSLGSFDL